MRIAIDLDGTIGEYIPGTWSIRNPILEGALERVNGWYDAGHEIVIDTSRPEGLRFVTELWLRKHGFKYHSLCMGKPDVDVIIDDRPRRFIKVETNIGIKDVEL